MAEIKSISYFYNENTFINYKRRILPLKRQLKNIAVEKFCPEKPEYSDVLILQALPADIKVFNDIINKKYSKYVVYDCTDDLGSVITPHFVRKIIWQIRSVIKGEKHLAFQRKELIEKCDLFICGSKMQVQTVKKINSKAECLVDCVTEDEYPLLYNSAIQKLYNETPTIVWEGTHSSMHQIQVVLDELLELQGQHKFNLVILSNIYNKKDEDFVSSLKTKGLKFTFVEWTLENFKETLAKADIAIAPIDVTKKFNRAKPYNKILSYWAYKLPVAASSIQSYNDIIEEGVDGFVCNSKTEWIKALAQLLKNTSLIKTMGEKGYEKAKANTENNFAQKYIQILNEHF